MSKATTTRSSRRLFAEHITRWSRRREAERQRLRGGGPGAGARRPGHRGAVVTTTPTTAAGQELRAHLEIVRPVEPQEDRIVPLRFNPTEYQVSKSNTFSEIPIPGLETPLLQYVRGGSEMLTLEALVDTSDTLADVRERYVEPAARADVARTPRSTPRRSSASSGTARSSPACWRASASPTCCSLPTGCRCGPGSACRSSSTGRRPCRPRSRHAARRRWRRATWCAAATRSAASPTPSTATRRDGARWPAPTASSTHARWSPAGS